LRESRVAIRDGPQKKQKRANLALSFYKASGLTQSILKAIPGFQIATDTVGSASNISSLATKNSGLVAMMVTTFLCVDYQ